MPENTLYYGDNLDILREYIADASVDLVYLDPPSIPTATTMFSFAMRRRCRSHRRRLPPSRTHGTGTRPLSVPTTSL